MEKEVVSKAPRGNIRKKVGTRDRLLFINLDPNRVYRLVSSDPSYLYEMEQLGYKIEDLSKHVPQGLRVSQPTSMDNMLPVGGNERHVLMSIDKESYEETQKEKQQHVNKIEAGIKPNSNDGQYGSVVISTS